MIENMIGCDWMVWMYLYDVYVCMYRMNNGRFEVKHFFLFKRAILLPVKVIRPMLILLNYRFKLFEHRWYTYTFHFNLLTHVDTLSSTTFYSTPYYSLYTRLELCLTRHDRRFDTRNFDGALNVIIRVSFFFLMFHSVLFDEATNIH